MSEYIKNAGYTGRDFRWHLLTTVSALALAISSPSWAEDDAGHPLLWIEIGGDADILSGTNAPFTAQFLVQTPTPTPYMNGSPINLQKPSRFTFGGAGNITLQPADSNWVFSVGIRYGRSNNKHNAHHQTAKITKGHNGYYDRRKMFFPNTPSRWSQYPNFKYVSGQKFAETVLGQSERHLIIDFDAGKDVGLGMFGHDGSSVLSVGVRLARFRTHSDVKIRAKPDIDFYSVQRSNGAIHYTTGRWSTYYLHGVASRDFDSIGPSLSWSASAPVAGNKQSGQLSLDWGINGALLFGRQKAKVSHHTTRRDFEPKHYSTFQTSAYHVTRRTYYFTHYKHTPPDQIRSRKLTAPNLGASIGISYRMQNFKMSFGYRADYFFGAMDDGIDAAKKTTLGFNGLYASISIGVGH